MSTSFLDLVNSERTAQPTRQVMIDRVEKSVAPANSICMTDAEYATLSAVIQRMVPQSSGTLVDIAKFVAEAKCQKRGNGWRYACLPSDEVSLVKGLRLLEDSSNRRHNLSFLSIAVEEQINLLIDVQQGNLNWPELDASLWFEELLSDAVEAYVSQPSTMAWMGFDGFAFLPRWNRIGLDTAEPWELAAE